MSNPKLLEELGIIIRIEGYFEPNDHTPRVMLDIIEGKQRIELSGGVDEFDSLLSQIQEEVDKISKRKYLD